MNEAKQPVQVVSTGSGSVWELVGCDARFVAAVATKVGASAKAKTANPAATAGALQKPAWKRGWPNLKTAAVSEAAPGEEADAHGEGVDGREEPAPGEGDDGCGERS